MVADRWKPVRKGKVFCSPACGGGCLFEDYEEARASAAELAAELGEGWKPHVYENMGWHYEARMEVEDYVPITIHKDKHEEEYYACGLAVYVKDSRASTPLGCVEKVLGNVSGIADRAANVRHAIVSAMQRRDR